MRWMSVLLLCSLGGCVLGCGALRDATVEDQKATLDMIVETLEGSGVEAYAFLRLPSRVGLFHEIGHDGEAVLFLRVNPGD